MKASLPPALTLATAGVAVISVALVIALAAVATEPDSLFTDDEYALFLDEAQAQGISVKRLLSGPSATALDSGFDRDNVLVLVVSPASPYSDEAVRAFGRLLSEGATALVADSSGYGSDLTSPLGITFDRIRLVESDPQQILPYPDGEQPLELPLVQPTALRLQQGAFAQTLASSSPKSFLDHDGDGIISESEPQGPFPVIASLDVGEGRLITVSDPSLITATEDSKDLRRWHRNLLQEALPDGGIILVDESRVPTDDPLVHMVRGFAIIMTTPPWNILLIVAGALSLAAIAAVSDEGWWGRHRKRAFDPILRQPAEGSGGAPLSHEPEGSWTPRGLVLLAIGFGLVMIGPPLGNAQATTAAAMVLVGAVTALMFRAPRIEAVRSVSHAMVVERGEVKVNLEVRSKRRRLPLEVRDRLSSYVDVVHGSNWSATRLGKKAQLIDYTMKPPLRGHEQVGPLEVQVLDPFSLRSHRRTVLGPESVRVVPQSEPLQKTPVKTRRADVVMGPHVVSRAGDGTEFHSLRGYQSGDSIRAINWKASARSGDLIVNQRSHESRTTTTLLLDARAIAGAGDPPSSPLNVACRAVLSISEAALRLRDQVRLYTYGDGVMELPYATGAGQAHRIRRSLAEVAAAGSTGLSEALPSMLHALRQGSSAIVLSSLEGDGRSVREAVSLLRSRDVRPVFIVPMVSTAGEPEARARDAASQQQEALRDLRKSGVTVFELKDGIPLDYLVRVGVGR